MTIRIFFANFASFIFEFAFDFLFWSFLLCTCISSNESTTQNFRFLYEQHQQNQINQKCFWFIQIKKIQKKYLVRKHELQIKSKIKQKTKKLLKQQKKVRLIKKRIEKYICRRFKNNTKFDNNIKFHEHIRIRHAKKSKFVFSQSIFSSFTFFQSIIFSFSVSSSRSIISSFFSSSKLLFLAISTSKTVRERSKNVSSKSIVELSTIFSKFSSKFLSIATSKKSIF